MSNHLQLNITKQFIEQEFKTLDENTPYEEVKIFEKIQPNDLTKVLLKISKFQTLKRFSFNFCTTKHFDRTQIELIFKIIRSNPLKSLVIIYAFFEQEEIETLTEILKEKTTLKEIEVLLIPLLKHLYNLEKLETSDQRVEYNTILGDVLKNNQSLKILKISNCQFEYPFKCFEYINPMIEEIYLDDVRLYGNKDLFKGLTMCKKLKKLRLEGVIDVMNDNTVLSQIINELDLEYLNLSFNKIDFKLYDIERQVNLKVLKLEKAKLKNQDLIRISNYVKENRVLIELDLGQNKFDEESLINFFKCLEENQTLKSLKLSDYTFKNMDFFVSFFKNNRSLEHLIMNYMNCQNFDGLVKGCIKNNSKLKQLDISSNKLTDSVIRDIFESLSYNCNLKMLNLKECEISQKNFQILNQELFYNSSLITLLHNRLPSKSKIYLQRNQNFQFPLNFSVLKSKMNDIHFRF